ncbi:MAG TPA: tetratricopeptide repeat protein [Pyrinomonadaceae bacterium]|nr:tetratricopeptide repeat protein [Pyrinomonadaceae bacterium]
MPPSPYRLAALLVSLSAAVAAHSLPAPTPAPPLSASRAATPPLAAPVAAAPLPAPRSSAHGVASFVAPRAAQKSAATNTAGASPSRRADNASTLIAQGIAALENADAATAKTLFERALKLDPKRVEAHTYLGVIGERAGDLAGAETHFAAAARLAPRSPEARNNYGAILFRRGRAALAAAEFEASLKLDPRQPSALVNLAQIRFASNAPSDLRAARDLFERARAIAPDPEIARALVVIALRLNERDAAAAAYRDYAALHAARAGADSGVVDAPAEISTPRARAELGAALLEADLLEAAAAELNAALSADPANVEAVVSLARVHRARKEVAAAGRLLETAVARGIDAAPVYAALADLYESIGRVENAIPAMRLAVERAPASEDYRFRYALLLVNSQAPKAAVIRLQEALREFPRSAKLWFALGLAYMTEHQSVEAAPALARAVELDPQAAPALAYLGLAHAEQGRYTEAIKFYERAVAVNPQLATVHYLLADILLKQNPADTVRPEKALLRAVELDPTLASARLALGKLYARTERLDSAAAQLTRAVALDPNSAETHYQLGRVYTRQRRTAEAQTALATFKRLNEGQKEQAQNERKEIVRRLANVHF